MAMEQNKSEVPSKMEQDGNLEEAEKNRAAELKAVEERRLKVRVLVQN